MKYKALILDLDGTTVANDRHATATPAVIDAITRASEKITVCIATARSLIEAQDIVDQLPINGISIFASGSQIYDPAKKKLVQQYTLDPQIVAEKLRVFRKYDLPLYIFDGTQAPYKYNGELPETVISIFVDGSTPQTSKKLEQELDGDVAVHRMTGWLHRDLECVEVTHRKAGKVHGIYQIQKQLGLSKAELIGVGDSYNDYAFLMACGLKVAMGNAVQELKDIADFIAPSVDDDGLVTVIKKFVL